MNHFFWRNIYALIKSIKINFRIRRMSRNLSCISPTNLVFSHIQSGHLRLFCPTKLTLSSFQSGHPRLFCPTKLTISSFQSGIPGFFCPTKLTLSSFRSGIPGFSALLSVSFDSKSGRSRPMPRRERPLLEISRGIPSSSVTKLFSFKYHSDISILKHEKRAVKRGLLPNEEVWSHGLRIFHFATAPYSSATYHLLIKTAESKFRIRSTKVGPPNVIYCRIFINRINNFALFMKCC